MIRARIPSDPHSGLLAICALAAFGQHMAGLVHGGCLARPAAHTAVPAGLWPRGQQISTFSFSEGFFLRAGGTRGSIVGCNFMSIAFGDDFLGTIDRRRGPFELAEMPVMGMAEMACPSS